LSVFPVRWTDPIQNMQNAVSTDAELLTDWLRHHREASFHQLVTRYAGLVHSAARRTGNDDTLAAEASQLVFILLARKAKSLASRGSLAGWLHFTAVMQTKNLLRRTRRENRKRALLQTAMETESLPNSHDSWKDMQPVLDEALAALSEKDREALLLRFYRSLTVKEIATTLGIATDAAQKRVDRATERLRGKLTQRGCQAGGSLAAVMLAGFTSDAQAAGLPLSMLTSKAIAASSAGSTTLAALLTTTAMKTTSFAPLIITLILGGTWIITQQQSIYALDRSSDLLESAVVARNSTASVDNPPVGVHANSSQGKGKASLDWREIADKMENAGFNDIEQMRFDQRISTVPKEELLSALDEIALLDIPQAIRTNLEEKVVFPLSTKFPEFAVTHLTGRDLGGFCAQYLIPAMEKWARQDFEKASTWMDARITSDAFATKALDGKNPVRIGYESVLIRTLLTKDEAQLSQRLSRIPVEMQKDVIMGIASEWRSYGVFEPAEETAFCKLVRNELPAEGQAEVFAARTSAVVSGGLAAVDKFFDTIEATPDERLRCVENVSSYWISSIAMNRTVTREDVIGFRDWLGKQVPQATERFLGESLAAAAGQKGISPNMYRNITYSTAADFAVEFSEASGGDELLTAFLKSDGGRSNKAQARLLAGKISDETLRAEILKNIK
jgi:RNA polymerase sigma factor (sigma-70 family)